VLFTLPIPSLRIDNRAAIAAKNGKRHAALQELKHQH
jgi:hypothetical protein